MRFSICLIGGDDLDLGLGGNHMTSEPNLLSQNFKDLFYIEISISPAKMPDDFFLVISSLERSLPGNAMTS